jgi:glutathione S-transferase
LILYHCIGGRSFRALWAMEELSVECELRVLPFPPRLTSPDYLAENPLGTIPLLIDGDTRMRESSMIGHYLATKAGSDLAVAPTEAAYGRYLDGLAYGETTLTWPQAVALLYGTFPPEAERLPRVVDDMKARLGVVFGDLDRLLGDREWFAADRFTMADVSIGYAIQLSAYIGPQGAALTWTRAS